MTHPDDKLSPAQLARLAVEAAPVFELIERAAPYLKLLAPAVKVLGRWDDEMGRHLEYADGAPDFMQAAIYRGIFVEMERRHGATAEFWGALAHAARQAPRPPAPAQRPDQTPPPTPAPAPAAPPAVEPAPSPRSARRKQPDEEEVRRIVKVMDLAGQTVRLIDGTGRMTRAQLSVALHELGIKNGSTSELSRVGTFTTAKRVKQGRSPGWSLEAANNMLEGLNIVYESLTAAAQGAA